MKKELVIFANSVKNGQHCVAGKDILTKKWIRSVGDINGCELTSEQATAEVLQKVKIRFTEHAFIKNQPENYVITKDKWIQNGSLNRN